MSQSMLLSYQIMSQDKDYIFLDTDARHVGTHLDFKHPNSNQFIKC